MMQLITAVVSCGIVLFFPYCTTHVIPPLVVFGSLQRGHNRDALKQNGIPLLMYQFITGQPSLIVKAHFSQTSYIGSDTIV